MSVLPHIIYRFKAILKKIIESYFKDIAKQILKLICKGKETRMATKCRRRMRVKKGRIRRGRRRGRGKRRRKFDDLNYLISQLTL